MIMNFLQRIRRIFPGRRRRVAVVTIAFILIGTVLGQQWVAREFEKRLVRGLAGRGLVLEHEGRDWNPWRGLRLVRVKIRQAADNLPLMESGNLMIHVPTGRLVRGDATTSHWQIRKAAVVLHDAEGSVRLDEVSLAVEAMPGGIRVRSATIATAGLTASVHGTILAARPAASEGPVSISWQPVRTTLAALDVTAAAERFQITGDFTVDATSAEVNWNARLQGDGRELTWHGIPLRSVSARANLSSGPSELDARMTLPHGSASFAMTREGWAGGPFRFRGDVVDEAGRKDTFRGSSQEGRLKVDRLEGPADLWAMAKGLPAVAPHLPRHWSVGTFPDLEVDDISAGSGQSQARWTVGNIRIRRAAEITVGLRNRNVRVSGITGEAGFDGTRWSLKQLRGKLFGGSVEVDGSLAGARLSRSHIVVEGLRWEELRRWAGHGGDRNSPGILHLDYRGDLDLRNGQASGEGKVRLENAPVLEVPLLDETYDLFAAMIPGVKPGGDGRFDATVIARPEQLEVTRFEAKGGSVTVSAAGTVDLVKERVDGRARGKLSGLPGLVTGPLGRLLEMDVSGPYDDIRVKPLGPAKLVSNAASTALDAPVETLKEAGKIAGTVVVESIKLPFRLFSKERRNEGENAPQEDR